MNVRRSISLALVWLCAAAGALVCGAPALGQRLHEFSKSFGSEGSGDGQLMRPGGMAVNEETGDVYVIDRGNGRVEIFNASGAYVGQFNGSAAPTGAFSFSPSTGEAPEGSIAVDNSTNPLDPSKGDVYVLDVRHNVVDKFSASGTYIGQVTGTSPTAPFELSEADSIGVEDIAVDSTGVLWVQIPSGYYLQKFDRFSDAVANEYESQITAQFPATVGSGQGAFFGVIGFALDAEDDIYTGRTFHGLGERFAVPAEFTKAGEVLDEEIDGEGTSSFAVDLSSDDVYVDHEESVAAYSPSHALVERFGAGQLRASEGVAVDSATGTVYAANASDQEIDVFTAFVVPDLTTGLASGFGETSVTVGGVVDPDGLPVTACEFEYGTSTSYGQSVPCSASPGSGSGPVAVSAQLVGLEHLTSYHFRLKASNANGSNVGQDRTFATPEPVGVSEESVADVSSTGALFSAQIDPNDADTKFAFEYGTSVSYGESQPVPAGDLGAGGSSVSAVVRAQGLLPGTIYHVRVVASNVLGTVYGPDQTFTTQSGGGGTFALADGRAWELVSPPIKDGAGVQLVSGLAQAAMEGGAVVYKLSGPPVANPPGNPSPAGATEVLSRRGAGGWFSEDIVTPHSAATEAAGVEYHLFSPDLSRAVLEPDGDTPLSPEATEETPYVRNNLECGPGSGAAIPDTCYVPLLTPGDVPPGTKFGAQRGGPLPNQVIAGTPDLSHVLFVSKEELTSNAINAEHSAGDLEWNLYEWAGGRLRLINVLPDGSASEGGQLGGGSENLRHAVSDDGSRVFWSRGRDEEPGAGQLYMRDTVTEKTLRVDVPAPGLPSPPGNGEAEYEGDARFEVASADGSEVFFTDTYPLTAESKLPLEGNRSPDLYVCRIVEEAGEPKCDLTDLTVDQNPGEDANVQQMVLGASEDGSWVYFVARGVLGDGGEHGAISGGNNLYVEHYNGAGRETRFIAALSQEDAMDWGEGESGPRDMTSRVSPDGRWLAFMSEQELTGYDNRDANSGRPDEEVFLYHTETSPSEALESGRLACASCNPTGARPDGHFEAEGAAEASLVDPSGLWQGRWLAANIPTWMSNNTYFLEGSSYQWRYLSNEGRLFFDSSDALAPQDTNGTEDVYEYEPPAGSETSDGDSCTVASATFDEKAGGCVSLISSGTSSEESAFVDASESGDDVFFATAARLTSLDVDTSLDVYDAHVCSAAAPCVSAPVLPPPCASGDACKPAPSLQPAIFGAPASATFSGSGNIEPPTPEALKPKPKSKPVQCGKGSVRKDGRCVRRKAGRKKTKARRAGEERRARS